MRFFSACHFQNTAEQVSDVIFQFLAASKGGLSTNGVFLLLLISYTPRASEKRAGCLVWRGVTLPCGDEQKTPPSWWHSCLPRALKMQGEVSLRDVSLPVTFSTFLSKKGVGEASPNARRLVGAVGRFAVVPITQPRVIFQLSNLWCNTCKG